MPCSNEANDGPSLPVDKARLAPMTEAHLEQVLEIERASFASPWTRDHFRFELQRNRWAATHVVRREGHVLAYVCVWRLYGELKINNIAVHPAWRRRGLARWLLDWVLRDAAGRGCRLAQLEVRPSNRPAVDLYLRRGFTVVGRRKGYYQREKEDALIMEVDLTPRCPAGPRGL